MDAVTLDHLLSEAAPRVSGRPVRRVRAAGGHALLLEVDRSVLWFDVGRETSGLYVLDRAMADRLRAEAEASGVPDAGSRQALLLIRKHLTGQRLGPPRRIPGERAVVLEAGGATLWLRLARPAVLTLAVDDVALAGFGGEATWPPPAGDESRSWRHLTLDAVAAASSSGERGTGALLAACPELGAQVARRVVRAPSSWPKIREGLMAPRPLVALPGPLAALADADLGSVELWPCALEDRGDMAEPPTWAEAAALFLELRLRGIRFATRRRPLLDAKASQVRRLLQLTRHLEQDLRGLPAEDVLRRQAEALLASAAADAGGGSSIEVPDPYDPAVSLHVGLDPRLSLPANADRLFEKARRSTRARAQVAARLEGTRTALGAAEEDERRLRSARRLADLPEAGDGEGQASDAGGPRRFLTSRGLMLLVGRGARENHELTFKVARPEDFWLHARDMPGAHVILRDPERRASPDDLREAAEVAAFFSRGRTGGPVDVHVTRRKHVQPAGGGPGRVRVTHSETERVTPRDPEGRLRKR